MFDQEWWQKNCNPNTDDWFDKDGYDSYGYDRNGRDRAGHLEDDYLTCGEWITVDDKEEYVYPLYDDVYSEWTAEQINGNWVPVERS